MLLTITTTHTPATDLGFLLHKHPARVQAFDLSFGKAHVFYSEATEQRCTAVLLLDIDSIALSRGRSGGSFALQPYVNDRPYVASSFLSVAIAEVYGTALNGRCAKRPELVEIPLPLQAKISALPCRGGEGFLRQLFEPLGYELTVTRHPLDSRFPEWGDSSYFTVEVQGVVRLRDLLAHLYLLIPVLDDEKHYWVGEDEVTKLLRVGEGWLANHPLRDQITHRYLRRYHHLTRAALAQLTNSEELEPDEAEKDAEETAVEVPIGLHQKRLEAVCTAIKETGASKVVDLGCGEGKLLQRLLKDKQFTHILGMDVSYRSLEIASERLHPEDMPERQRKRIELIQGSLMYQDSRLAGYEAAAVVEVIEHLDPPRLAAFERVLFEFARPGTAVITTPNAEYNIKWPSLPAGKFRHRDHRFEWTRAQFQQWANGVASQFGYTAEFAGIGEEDTAVGCPTQMAVFTLTQVMDGL